MSTNNSNTSSLFHYTKKVGDLKLILENGLKPNYCKEDFSKIIDMQVIGIPMICFCDIPISRASTFRQGKDDTGYGNYALGLTKEWGIMNNINPILYVSNGSVFNALQNYSAILAKMKYDAEKDALETVKKHPNFVQNENGKRTYTASSKIPNSEKTLCEIMINHYLQADKHILYGLIKPYKNKDKNDYINYNENEWRYVVCNDWLWDKDKYDKWRGKSKLKPPSKFEPLKFNIADVNFIILENKSDVSDFVTYIRELKVFGGNKKPITDEDKNILLTKIITIDDIESNF